MSLESFLAIDRPGTAQPVLSNLAQYFLGNWEDLKRPYDYIVIGGGAYGTTFAERILRAGNGRVLVLEKGSIFFPDHAQNLPPAYVDAVYGPAVSPWICDSNFTLAPQQPYVGGRALFWNAWVPQPRSFEFPHWPASVVASLDAEWYPLGERIGRRFSLACAGNDNRTLDGIAKARLFEGNASIACAVPLTMPSDLDSAMATGADVAPGQFAKYAPVKTLVALAQAYPDRLKVVPLTTVARMQADGGRIARLELVSTDQHRTTSLDVGAARIVLANNTIEAAALCLTALPEHPLLGKNLCVHNRSALTFRIPAGRFPALADQLQVCAYYQLGQVDDERFFHNHISVVFNPHPAEDEDLLYRVLPDASSAQSLAMYREPGYVYVLVQALGEMLGERSPKSWNRVSVRNGQTLITLREQPQDADARRKMNQSVKDIVRVLSAGAPVQYMHAPLDKPLDITWRADLPDIDSSLVFHEAGTLWMGDSPNDSVTDTSGKLHGIGNLYGTGSMLFPSPGSWNPTYTGMAMTSVLAKRLGG
ncbi:GMC family oxidoreductase [Burkholderia sp. Bp8963]|uniref:GMC oxidoreductase n=1 Tax=Burkholderia sp. Bp8963 TaxID=2184547 RepID=UPI000F5B6049|nr:GMC oxidoreductase [Burkholderia sp. Bp8963]RQS67448.1 GMC family oxidoreductase [Burkholderia sp. Bp8963]